MDLFGRCLRVTAFQVAENSYFELGADAVEITEMRVQFQISKSLGKEPNTCEITVTNLSKEERAFLQRPRTYVRLEAGYNEEYRHLFSGDVLDVVPTRAGVDHSTLIQVADGARAFLAARSNRSYGAGVTLRQVLNDAARSMQLELPKALVTSTDLDQQFANGFSMSGWTRDELTRLLAPYGYAWSVQSGQLQILRDEDVSPETERLITGGVDGTGIIGSPELGSSYTKAGKLVKGGKPKLTVSCLLYPEITPGGRIRVESPDLNGSFRVQQVQHTGDTYGPEWTSTIEAKAL